jgi:hypothetical protein
MTKPGKSLKARDLRRSHSQTEGYANARAIIEIGEQVVLAPNAMLTAGQKVTAKANVVKK